MDWKKQKNNFIVVLLMTLLFSLAVVRTADAKKGLDVEGLTPLDSSVLKAAAGIAPAPKQVSSSKYYEVRDL